MARVMATNNKQRNPWKKKLEEPPDGGWGWMVVCASFIVLFIVRGIQNSIGVFFVVLMDHFQEGAGSTSWLTTCLTSLSLCTGPISGALSKRFGHRKVVMLGGLLAGTSIFITAFATNIIYVTVTFGVLTGIGFGLARVPAVALMGRYFKKRHAIASGIAVVGTGAGSFSIAPSMRFLIDIYGWRGTFMLMGGLALNLCVGGALLRPIYLAADDGEDKDASKPMSVTVFDRSSARTEEILPDKSHKSCCKRFFVTFASYFELGLFKDAMFVTLMVCYSLFGFGVNIPTIHIVKRAVNVGVPEHQAPLLLSALGFAMMIGGFVQGFVVDLLHLPKCRVFASVVFIYGLLTLFLPVAKDFVSICTLMSIMGLARGVFAALNSVVVRVVVGHNRFTGAYGTSLVFIGVPQLVGPVVAGYLYDYTEDYRVSFYLSGTCLLLSGLILFVGHCIWERGKATTKDEEDDSPKEVIPDYPGGELQHAVLVVADTDDDGHCTTTKTILLALSDDDKTDCLECAGTPSVDFEEETAI
ncbi:monocarboxylate transporter 12-like [Ptychodera flava]|uniref:monocarboxylate transporter 12-like n=1 Tax=Ptychodera flava TaxID=63121 RepID=UPI003969CCC3